MADDTRCNVTGDPSIAPHPDREQSSMSTHGSYWAGTGTHQAEFKRLRAALVPVGGAAATPHGELLRAADRLYYHLKTNGLRDVEARWDEWRTVCAHRHLLTTALGPQGTWAFWVVDRAITERYLNATWGADFARRKFPHDAFERLMDGCVLAVRTLHREAA